MAKTMPNPTPEQGGPPSMGDGSESPERPPSQEKRSQPEAGASLRGRLDQVGAILAKGLDLAEAGVSLGVTIINRVGTAAQHQIRERAHESAMARGAAPESSPAHAAETGAGPSTRGAHDETEIPAEPAYGITNRLPLMPGGLLRISFSVNNDSLTEPKKVECQVEGFVGDTHGQRLEGTSFAVKPGSRTIAPADFEKFVLHGTVPAEAPSDVYRGGIVVASESELFIPVILVVASL